MKQPKTKNPTSSIANIPQDLGCQLCSSLPCSEVSPAVCVDSVAPFISTPTPAQEAHRKHWQSTLDTRSGSFRESQLPAHGRGGGWCGHAGRSGAAEPQRAGDGRDGAAVLRVQQQAVLLLWFRHLWGTHQGKAGALCLSFPPSSHTFKYQRRKDAEGENSPPAIEQATSAHSTAHPHSGCCLSFGFEVHVLLLQTLLSQWGWWSAHLR